MPHRAVSLDWNEVDTPVVRVVTEQENGCAMAQMTVSGKHTLQQQPSTMALSSPAKLVAAPQGEQTASQGHLHGGFVPPHKL